MRGMRAWFSNLVFRYRNWVSSPTRLFTHAIQAEQLDQELWRQFHNSYFATILQDDWDYIISRYENPD